MLYRSKRNCLDIKSIRYIKHYLIGFILIFALVIVPVSLFAINYSISKAEQTTTIAKIEKENTLEYSKTLKSSALKNAEYEYSKIINEASFQATSTIIKAKEFVPDYLQLTQELQKEFEF